MMIRMMKKSRTILIMVCITVMMMATGCGTEKEAPVTVDLSSKNLQQDEKDNQEPSKGDEVLPVQEPNKEEDIIPVQESLKEELSGDVRSVGQDSFVICKETTYSEGDADIAVAPAPGAEEADSLVTVYVNPDCTYQYETVKNGGVNPEDISTRDGSWRDLKEGAACILQGSWRDGSFYADSVEIMEFVW